MFSINGSISTFVHHKYIFSSDSSPLFQLQVCTKPQLQPMFGSRSTSTGLCHWVSPRGVGDVFGNVSKSPGKLGEIGWNWMIFDIWCLMMFGFFWFLGDSDCFRVWRGVWKVVFCSGSDHKYLRASCEAWMVLCSSSLWTLWTLDALFAEFILLISKKLEYSHFASVCKIGTGRQHLKFYREPFDLSRPSFQSKHKSFLIRLISFFQFPKNLPKRCDFHRSQLFHFQGLGPKQLHLALRCGLSRHRGGTLRQLHQTCNLALWVQHCGFKSQNGGKTMVKPRTPKDV